MRNNRREREKSEMKELILKTASTIIGQEGVDGLSIRKIASAMEYSPSIIYHYFKNKDEIINQVMQEGYSKIVNAVTLEKENDFTPIEMLKEMTRNYIGAALKMPDEFLNIQLNHSQDILLHTSFLFKGAAKKKPALKTLSECLKAIYLNQMDDDIIELTAQMIATATLGLIIKLIIEKIDEVQKQRLIDFYVNEIVVRLTKIN